VHGVKSALGGKRSLPSTALSYGRRTDVVGGKFFWGGKFALKSTPTPTQRWRYYRQGVDIATASGRNLIVSRDFGKTRKDFEYIESRLNGTIAGLWHSPHPLYRAPPRLPAQETIPLHQIDHAELESAHSENYRRGRHQHTQKNG
jgi:hypothetical protein